MTCLITNLLFSLDFWQWRFFYFDTIRSSTYSLIARAHIRKACTSLTSYNDHAVDRLLRMLNISILHLHDAICAVITDWEFNASRSERWKQNNEFMKDVHKKFRNESSSVEMRLKLLSDNVLKNDYLIEIKREDQELHSREEVMNMMRVIRRADSQASKDTVSEENAVDIVDDDKQSSMSLDNEMNRRILNEYRWAQAFQEELKMIFDM